MVDIHCHVLPGMDDGARSMEAALEMLRVAAESGITDIVATPHADERYNFDPAAVNAALTDLRAASEAPPRLHYGCEMHLTPENVERAMREPWQYTLAHGGWLLVEFSNTFVPRNAGQILQRLRAAGARPVIAHPERNPILRQRAREIAAWVEEGCLVQVTAQSLLGQFGRSAESAALEMVAEGLVHCVASDAHDPQRRPPALRGARQFVEGAFGGELAQTLFEKKPRAVLYGLEVARCRPPAAKKSWYSVW